MNNELNQKLLENKVIYLNLSLQERTLGLNEIVADWSSYFGLDIYFWNLSQTQITKLNQRKNRRSSDIHFCSVGSVENSTSKDTIQNAKTKIPVIKKIDAIVARLIEIYHSQEKGIYIIENIDTLISSNSLPIVERENLRTWLIKVTTKFRESQDCYLVISGSCEDEWQLQNAIPRVHLPFMTIEEVQQLLEKRFAQLKLENYQKTHLISKAAHILLGLTKPELEWGLRITTNNLENERSVDNYLVKLLEYKIDRLKDLGLKFLPFKDRVDVGGMDILKEAIDQMSDEFAPEARIDNIPIPKGWIIAGVPGAGKSYIARYIAQRLRMPLIYISLESIRTKGAGYLAWILERVEAAAPNVVYIDEFDKLFPEQEDEQTTAVKGLLLTWLQEKRSQCFALATLNRLDALPPEMTRSGRFDYIWYVGFPQPIERLEIFKYHLKFYDKRFEGEFDFSKEQWQKLLNKTINFTGAEIESVIKKTIRAKYHLKKAQIRQAQQQINSIKTLVKSWIDPQHFSEFEDDYLLDFNALASAVACNPEVLLDMSETDVKDSLAAVSQAEVQKLEMQKVALEIDFDTLYKFTKQEIPLFKRDPEQVNAIENRAKDIGTPVSSKDTSRLIDEDRTFWPEQPKVPQDKLNVPRGYINKSNQEDLNELTPNQIEVLKTIEEEIDPKIEAVAEFFS